jgi:hypothetical protein
MGKKPAAKMLIAVCFFVCICFLPLLAACGSNAGQPLTTIHTEGQIEKLVVISGDECIKCHAKSTIIKETQNSFGEQGLCIHQPPKSMPYGDCDSCHSVDSQPVLTCNAANCHQYKLPEGWVNP